MRNWGDYFQFLRCVNCGGKVLAGRPPAFFSHNEGVDGGLECQACGAEYPVFQGIPVMFVDEGRTKILIDKTNYEVNLKKAEEQMAEAAQVTGDELGRFKRKDQAAGALGWEMLFWEKWKQNDEGFLDKNTDKICQYLEKDTEGGGRLRFFDKVRFFADKKGNHRLLNIGAGRDFLLERFVNAGFEVVEQDIVLEPLLFLKKRGAGFCVCGDARALPFADDVFGAATSFSVLHHIWPINEPIAELLRVTSGCVHFNEPNSFALTRAALLLPGPLKRRLKANFVGDYSHSPYEESINPFFFRKLAENFPAEIVDFSYTRSSWISAQEKGLKKVLRALNIVIANLLPVVSSHFDAVIRKKGQ